MKLSIALGVLLLAAVTSAQIQTRVVALRVDHFSILDRRMYDNRYFVNSVNYQPGGPIYIYLSGGIDDHEEFLEGGAVFEIAQDTFGHVFSLEHRFYGESRPTEDTSLNNLRWLTIDQALADIAQFIVFIRANYVGTENSAVIVWGRGYGGVLAAWARQKYPHLVAGAWASSAEINAIWENTQFMPNTFYTINSIGGPECGDIITGAFRMIEDAIRLQDTSYVEERLRLCNPIDLTVEDELNWFFYFMASQIGYGFVGNARYPEIDEKCIIMLGLNDPGNPAENDLDAFARWFVDDFNEHLECLNYNHTAVWASYQDTRWDSVSSNTGLRQSLWRACVELGQMPTANEGEGHPFGWRFNYAFFKRWCGEVFDRDLFADDFMEASVARTNGVYGGLNPSVYRVFFTNGEMDPQRNLSPINDLNPLSPAVVMSLQSRGRDLGSPADTDYAVLQQVKARARELILQWIVDHGQELPTPPPPTEDPGPPTEFY